MIGIGSDGWVYGPLNKQSLPELVTAYVYYFLLLLRSLNLNLVMLIFLAV